MVQYEPAAVRLLVQMMDPTFVCTVSVPVPRVLHPLPGAARAAMGIFQPGRGGGLAEGQQGQRVLMVFFGFFSPPSHLFSSQCRK